MISSLKILQDQVASCNKCELSKTRTQTVFSRGNPLSYIMICGESPGQEEDLQGKPFVGKSGQLLDKALTELGLNIENDIYVVNIIKCRPPSNRTPTQEECDTCFPYLQKQINIINPKVIVALGSTAMNNLINTTLGITKMHGKVIKAMGSIVIPTFHPSWVLRNGGYNSNSFQVFKQDLELAIQLINNKG